MVTKIDSQFDIDNYKISFIDDDKYAEFASNNACIIRINELGHEWEEAGKIALYKDELRIESNLEQVNDSNYVIYQKDGITKEQVKLMLHVIEENKNLNVIISSTNLSKIKTYLFNI